MKKTKLLSLLSLTLLMFWSCSDDEATINLTQPTFTITAPEGESGLYTFENTTPNKSIFYNFWQFEVGGQKFADQDGSLTYEYDANGPKIVTLTMVSSATNMQTSQSLTVTLPPPPDVRDRKSVV